MKREIRRIATRRGVVLIALALVVHRMPKDGKNADVGV